MGGKLRKVSISSPKEHSEKFFLPSPAEKGVGWGGRGN